MSGASCEVIRIRNLAWLYRDEPAGANLRDLLRWHEAALTVEEREEVAQHDIATGRTVEEILPVAPGDCVAVPTNG